MRISLFYIIVNLYDGCNLKSLVNCDGYFLSSKQSFHYFKTIIGRLIHKLLVAALILKLALFTSQCWPVGGAKLKVGRLGSHLLRTMNI